MKFWHDNKLDQEVEYDPKEVARKFLVAVHDGYDLSRSRLSYEFAFRWWLTDPQAFNASWDVDSDDDPNLMDALFDVMTDADRELILERIGA